MDLTIRPRRLRKGEILRKMVRETRMDPSSLIYPMFVREGEGIAEEIPTMPGQYRYSVDRMGEKLDRLKEAEFQVLFSLEFPVIRTRQAAAPGRKMELFRKLCAE